MAEALGGDAKRCRDCGIVKAASEFWRRKQSPDGLALYCKECFGLRNAASYRGRLAVQGKQARPYRRYSAVPPGMKYCANCGETKPVSEFGRNCANKSGLAYYCRPCHNDIMAANKQKNHGSTRSYHLKRRYGLSADDVAERQTVQLDRCLICRRAATLHVDHDHETGKFRGLLCFNCNNGLGQFRDDVERLRRAADYVDGVELTHEVAAAEPIVTGVVAVEPSAERLLRRHYKLTERYGIGLDDVERMIEEQGGVCPICRSASPRDIDHDHETGEVRGVLCPGCNSGMGLFGDDARRLRDAAAYLEAAAGPVPGYLALHGTRVLAGDAPGLAPVESWAEARLRALIAEFGVN